jgi:hypothetical protein
MLLLTFDLRLYVILLHIKESYARLLLCKNTLCMHRFVHTTQCLFEHSGGQGDILRKFKCIIVEGGTDK